MPQAFGSPGVYRQEVVMRPPPVLETGVPAFVGIAGPPPGGTARFNVPLALYHKEDFAGLFAPATRSFLADAVAGFFDNGGSRCYVVAADPQANPEQALVDAIAVLAPLDDMDLLAVPDAAILVTPEGAADKAAIARVQTAMLLHCAQQGNRFAILDSLPGASVDDVTVQCAQLAAGRQEPVNGALYYPWLLTASRPVSVPPCGHVAGIYRRSDDRTGVFKAPANEEVFGVLDLETQIDGGVQDQLNPARVNCLRAFPGRGIRVWGARTVGPVPPDLNWLYVNVRRLFLTLRRWIDTNMGWATFEPNDVRLWVRVRREMTVFLTGLQRDGALKGATPDEAFFVKCDAENNPPEVRDIGQLIVEIGLAPLSPAEFIVVRIVRHAGGEADS